MSSPQHRIETLEAAANRVATAAMVAAIAESSGIPTADLMVEATRILALTDGYTPAERIQWLASDSGIPADEIRRDAAAILATVEAA